MPAFIVFDTEDNSQDLMLSGKSGFDKRVTQIAAIKSNGIKYHNRGSVEGFFQWLLVQPEKLIYAHNLQYDLGNLFANNLDCLDLTLVGGRLIKARWQGKTFLDSFNLWPMALSKVGEAFNLKKGKLNANSKQYVFRDCEITRRAVQFVHTFCECEGLDRIPSTLGGLALQCWKQWGGSNEHDSLEISRSAYYGGRVELFASGGSGSIFYTDINSLYPYCMTKAFPSEMLPMRSFEKGEGIAHVKIDIPEQFIAPLPYRHPKDGRIFYPIGRIEGYWTFAEIRNAIINHGATVLRYYGGYGSLSAYSPYKDFVSRCYVNRRNAKSSAERLFWKLVMNNLYGRLGLTGRITRSVYLTLERLYESGTIPYGEKCLASYQMPLDENVNWSHAAHVTAYARLELMSYLRLLGENLIYCDTDSVFFFANKIPFSVGNELGQMKLVDKATKCRCYAPKAYDYGGQFKAKGMKREKAKEYITSGMATIDLPFKLREAIAYFDDGNKRKLSVWRKVTKIFNGVYDRKSFRNGMFFPLAISSLPD